MKNGHQAYQEKHSVILRYRILFEGKSKNSSNPYIALIKGEIYGKKFRESKKVTKKEISNHQKIQ